MFLIIKKSLLLKKKETKGLYSSILIKMILK